MNFTIIIFNQLMCYLPFHDNVMSPITKTELMKIFPFYRSIIVDTDLICRIPHFMNFTWIKYPYIPLIELNPYIDFLGGHGNVSLVAISVVFVGCSIIIIKAPIICPYMHAFSTSRHSIVGHRWTDFPRKYISFRCQPLRHIVYRGQNSGILPIFHH